MKKFLAVFIGSANGAKAAQWEAMDEKTRNEREHAGMMAWQEWVIKNQSLIIGMGGPLGVTKQINAKGISDIHNALTAYTVVQAESHEAAAKLFLEHPHFTIFPGDSVEVMEVLPIPGQ